MFEECNIPASELVFEFRSDQEGEDAAKSQQFARYKSRILTLQGSHLRSISAYILLIILLDIPTSSLL